jgi:hypothetical protein
MATYTEIPMVPEGTLDPAAGLNLALRILRALTQTTVVEIGLTAPPGSPNDGDKYIVGAGATGDWAGMDDYLAEYVSEGDHWDFFAPGDLARFVVNLDDGQGYYYDPNTSGWVPLVVAS